MPRNARPARKRHVKWCRTEFNALVPSDAALDVDDPFVLCTITTAIADAQDITVSGIRIAGSVSRNTVDRNDVSLAYVVALQKFDFGTGNLLQVVDPWSDVSLASQDILAMGQLPVPAIVLDELGVRQLSGEAIPFEINVKAQRKLQRNTHTITLTYASTSEGPSDQILRVRSISSLLMKFG